MDRVLVLASASPRRQALLRRLGPPFRVLPAHVDETVRAGETPEAYALRLAAEKARHSPVESPEAVVLGADTIVVLDGEVIGKPADAAEATDFLQRLRDRRHTVVTAVAVLDRTTGRLEADLARTTVHMRDYADAEIAAYVASGDPFDKAGGYGIQNPAFQPVAEIDGSYSNVMGLPLALAARLLSPYFDTARPTEPSGG